MKFKLLFFLVFYFYLTSIFSQTLNEDFLVAVYENNEVKIFDLMRKGADVNTISIKGISPIMYSVQNGNYLITKKLLDAGANPNYQSKHSPPALINAIINNDTALVYLLLEYGADPNIIENTEKKYPILYAIDRNNYVLVDLLFWYGANANQSSNNNIPLFYAIDYNADTSIINLIIKNNANIDTQNINGFTPLIEAVLYNNINVVKILLEKNANTEIRDFTSEKYNALDYAYKYHLTEITDLLLPYFKDDAKKYHSIALSQDYLIGAKKIRQITGEKYLSPIISNITIAPSMLFSFNDLYMGGKIGFKEARYNIETNFGVLPRLFKKRILIEVSPNNYLQLWEKRTMLFFEVNKNFNLVYSDEKISGIYIKAGANFSFGSYDGIHIDYQKPVVPSFGLGMWSKKDFIKFSLGYEYLPIQTNFPHFVKLDLIFYLPFKFEK